MRTYIIRIYREEKDRHEQLLGTVERVGADAKIAFTSREELWNIVGPSAGKRDGSKRKETREE